jgi:hypothetical protein
MFLILLQTLALLLLGTTLKRHTSKVPKMALEHKCDMAVIKRQVVIQDAKDLYDFAEKEFRDPAASRYQSQNVGFFLNHCKG